MATQIVQTKYALMGHRTNHKDAHILVCATCQQPIEDAEVVSTSRNTAYKFRHKKCARRVGVIQKLGWFERILT